MKVDIFGKNQKQKKEQGYKDKQGHLRISSCSLSRPALAATAATSLLSAARSMAGQCCSPPPAAIRHPGNCRPQALKIDTLDVRGRNSQYNLNLVMNHKLLPSWCMFQYGRSLLTTPPSQERGLRGQESRSSTCRARLGGGEAFKITK